MAGQVKKTIGHLAASQYRVLAPASDSLPKLSDLGLPIRASQLSDSDISFTTLTTFGSPFRKPGEVVTSSHQTESRE